MVVVALGGDDDETLPDDATHEADSHGTSPPTEFDSSLCHEAEIVTLLNMHHEQLLGELRGLAEILQSRVFSAPALQPSEGRNCAEAWVFSGAISPDSDATSSKNPKAEDSEKRRKRKARLQAYSAAEYSQSLSSIMLSHGDHSDRQEAERISSSLAKLRTLSVTSGRRPATLLQRVVNNVRFELFFGIAIATNALLTGIEVQYASKHIGEDPPVAFEILQHVYATVFLVELCMRIKASGCRHFYSKQCLWAYFDTFIVAIGILDLAIDIVMRMLSSPDVGTLENAYHYRMVRMIRITRLARAFRVQRILRLVTSLRILVDAIFVTLRSLIWALILLAVIIYVFSVTFTQSVVDYLGSQSDVDTDLARDLLSFYGSVYDSMATLYQAITGGVSWRECWGALKEVSPFIAFAFETYIAFTYFAVLNVVTGVFCSSALEAAKANPELIAHQMASHRAADAERIKDFFKTMDDTGSNIITIHQLEEMLSDDHMTAHLAAMGVVADDAWTLFKLIDTDRGGTIDMDEFMQGLRRLKGEAKAMDIASIKYDIHMLGITLHRFMQDIGGDSTSSER